MDGEGKGTLETSTPTSRRIVVVTQAWGVDESSPQVTCNQIGAWFEIMLRERYPYTRPRSIYFYPSEDQPHSFIVELPSKVDISPYLGSHRYEAFLKGIKTSPSDVASLYEYDYKNFGDPAQHWSRHCPEYTNIPEAFPIRSPYPQPGPVFPAPGNSPFAIDPSPLCNTFLTHHTPAIPLLVHAPPPDLGQSSSATTPDVGVKLQKHDLYEEEEAAGALLKPVPACSATIDKEKTLIKGEVLPIKHEDFASGASRIHDSPSNATVNFSKKEEREEDYVLTTVLTTANSMPETNFAALTLPAKSEAFEHQILDAKNEPQDVKPASPNDVPIFEGKVPEPQEFALSKKRKRQAEAENAIPSSSTPLPPVPSSSSEGSTPHPSLSPAYLKLEPLHALALPLSSSTPNSKRNCLEGIPNGDSVKKLNSVGNHRRGRDRRLGEDKHIAAVGRRLYATEMDIRSMRDLPSRHHKV